MSNTINNKITIYLFNISKKALILIKSSYREKSGLKDTSLKNNYT